MNHFIKTILQLEDLILFFETGALKEYKRHAILIFLALDYCRINHAIHIAEKGFEHCS